MLSLHNACIRFTSSMSVCRSCHMQGLFHVITAAEMTEITPKLAIVLPVTHRATKRSYFNTCLVDEDEQTFDCLYCIHLR